MINNFNTIGIIGYSCYKKILFVCRKLCYWLNKNGYKIIVDNRIINNLSINKINNGNINYIGKQADLAIVIGGDGNMLGAIRDLAYYRIKIIGINCGNLGFLTDINYNSLLKQLSEILSGNYIAEKRLLLEAYYIINGKKKIISNAINEILLQSNNVRSMINISVYIDNKFAFLNYADGLIISTPTGSTAYSLSVGGPIITPLVKAIMLLPLFPHTLSSRPIIINNTSIVKLLFSKNSNDIKISFDNQIDFILNKEKSIYICSSNRYFNLIHPIKYNYFNLLRKKLFWLKNYRNFSKY
ncbi:MAG: NAD(+)/NADH kinase [Candidatus Lightella neohaematopini]|nr:NAD(+)/NADH kinase [Candidatus Lightella neohaematopini]MCV2529008.1 NAD(+)/NADH kinase [Candidatus Lightella neohaematopini]